MQTVVLTGSRGWANGTIVDTILRKYQQRLGDELQLLVGFNSEKDYPPGLDRIAYNMARKLDIPVSTDPADWDNDGKKTAGMVRNGRMVAQGDHCVGFWDGTSPGTADCLYRARKKKILRSVYLSDGRRYDGTSDYLFVCDRSKKIKLPPGDPLLLSTAKLSEDLESYGWEYDPAEQRWWHDEWPYDFPIHPHMAYLWEIRDRDPGYDELREEFPFIPDLC
jgi:hypothetical protein